ncbi:hypothetical protein BDM02DRAFT_3135379, partial [Thelephora ganbajun]
MTGRQSGENVLYIKEPRRTPGFASQAANLFPFVVDKTFILSFTFFALLRRPIPHGERFDVLFVLSNHHTMSVSGSRGTTYQGATSSMVSSIPEGGSLACKQCGALICSLKSLVSSVSALNCITCTRSISDTSSSCTIV